MRERRPKEARALAIAVARVAVRSAARLQVELDSSSIMAGDQEAVQGELARLQGRLLQSGKREVTAAPRYGQTARTAAAPKGVAAMAVRNSE